VPLHAEEPSNAQSLVAMGREGQGKPSPEPSFNIHDFTRVKNAALILKTLIEKGSNTKSKTILHTFNSSSRCGPIVDELIDVGAIEILNLRGDRNWISISPKGRNIVKHWRRFLAAFNGGNLGD